MTITNAAELHTTWAARFNTQDLDGMIALLRLRRSSCRNRVSWWRARGVRAAEQQFLRLGVPIALKVRRVIVSGDIALLISDWSLKGKAADGSDVDVSGTTADVARRGPERSESLE